MNSQTPTDPGIYLLRHDMPALQTILESIADIHAHCILKDHQVATFLPPLSRPEMIQHWQHLAAETTDTRITLIHLSRVSDRSMDTQIESPFPVHDWLQLNLGADARLEVSGVVSLSMPASQTGPFRGLVQKLFVSPLHRRRGLATRLMAELERQALARDRWSLMLDTAVGTPAELLYPKLGYRVLGVVENYGYTPKDHSLVDEVFFWKDLRSNPGT